MRVYVHLLDVIVSDDVSLSRKKCKKSIFVNTPLLEPSFTTENIFIRKRVLRAHGSIRQELITCWKL